MTSLLLVLRIGLAAVFVVAAAAKLADRSGARSAMRDFGVPERAVAATAILLPLAELAIAGALIPDRSARVAAACAAALLAIFTVAIAVSLARGRKPDCHCFGQLHSAPAGTGALVRNLGLAAVAGVIVWQPSAVPGVDGWAIVVAAIVAALAVQARFSYGLLRQNGRILTRLANAEAKLEAGGHPASHSAATGSRAPHFSLQSLTGDTVALPSLLTRGRPVLLAFIDAGCGPCMALVPRLAEWQQRASTSLQIVVVAPVEAAADPAWATELDLVLLQPGGALSTLYGIRAMPSAVLIDADGRIAGAPAEGGEAVAELAENELAPHSGGHDGTADRNGALRAPSAALGVGAAGLVTVAAGVSAAEAASPEREAISSLIAEAQPRLTAEAVALERAAKRCFSTLTPSRSSRAAVSRAIAAEATELETLHGKVTASPVTTQLGRDAQRLTLETIELTIAHLTKLDRAVRAKSERSALRALSASRAALDKALQRGINARAALSA